MILYGNKGWGSAIVEAQLELLGLPFEFVAVGDLFASPEARETLRSLNPLCQVPTLVAGAGEVLTESAAITLSLTDLTSSGYLVPTSDDADRRMFLRWLIYIVANIYPTFTYADEPSRLTPNAGPQEEVRSALRLRANAMYAHLEDACLQPFFLGDRFSALDIYICVMTRWYPKRDWFAVNAPNLNAVAKHVDEMPELEQVWTRNFGPVR